MIAPALRSVANALRWALGLATAFAVLWAFARVGGRAFEGLSANDGRAELVVMHWSGEGGQEEDAIVQEALARYEREHPGVRVKRINPGDAASFYTKLQTMMAAGTPPDVFYVGAERLSIFARAGLLLALDEYVAESGLELDDFYPKTVEAFRYDGERAGKGALYGLPKDFTTVGFYWNKDLFDRAGAKHPTPGWTWDDFATAARSIGALEGCTGAEFVTWPAMVRAYLLTEGVDVVGEDFDDVRLDDPAVHAALERLRAWRHDEQHTLTSGKSRIATGATAFLTGDIGLAGPFGRWVVPSYGSIDAFEWDFAPLPRGAADANIVLTVAWSVSSRTEHPRAAWELARALTGAEAQASAARLGLAIPTRRAVAESEAFLDADVPPANDAGYLAAAEVAELVRWPADPRFESLFETRMNQALKTGDLPLDQASANFASAWKLASASPLARGDFPVMPWKRISIGLGGLLAVVGWIVAWRLWRRRPGALAWREELWGFALVAPWMIGFALFLAFPIGLSLALSFAKWSGLATLDRAEFVGLANYAQLLGHDERFHTSLKVTAYYALLAVPGGQLFALGAALLMNAKVRGIGFFRAAWYLPSVLAGVGVAVLWRWVFDGDTGLLNALMNPLLGLVGLSAPDWFGGDAAAFGAPAFALLSLWMVGGSMMIYLAGLKGIPEELYEAAAIDGAGAWHRFRAVTLPMLSPVLLFNGIMAVIASFQVFTQAFVMTNGEPGDLTRFYVLYLYNQAFDYYEMGYASAMAWLLLLLVLALSAFLLRGSRGFVHYEALRG